MLDTGLADLSEDEGLSEFFREVIRADLRATVLNALEPPDIAKTGDAAAGREH